MAADICRFCGVQGAPIPCIQCKVTCYCCVEHRILGRAGHSAFCHGLETVHFHQSRWDTQFRDFWGTFSSGPEPDFFDWNSIPEPLASWHLFRVIHGCYVKSVSASANLLAHESTVPSLTWALADFRQVARTPLSTTRIWKRCIPALHLQLGMDQDGLAAIHEAHKRSLGRYPQPDESIGDLHDIGYQALRILIKMKTCVNLQEMKGPLEIGNILPAELVTEVQKQIMGPLTALIPGVLTMMVSADGLNIGIRNIRHDVTLLITTVHQRNPWFWPGFFAPSLYFITPLTTFWAHQPSFPQLPHRCNQSCQNALEHRAQIAFLDVSMAFFKTEGAMETIQGLVRETVGGFEIDMRVRSLQLRGNRIYEDPEIWTQIGAENIMNSPP